MLSFNALMRLPIAKKFPKGTVIVAGGSAGADEMYVLLQGEAGVFKNYRTPEELQIDTLGEGTYFGETAFLIGKAFPSSVVAMSDCSALVIDRKNAPGVFAKQPDLAIMIMEGICRKLDTVTGSYEKLLDVVRGGPVIPTAAPTPPQAQAPQPEPAKPKTVTAPSKSSSLFPEGHGHYSLEMDNDNDEYLYEQKLTCPVCGHVFANMTVITSKLRREGTDNDLRVHYKDIEPLYYDVITCPACCYSAMTESFPEGSKRWLGRITDAVKSFKDDMAIKTGRERDAFTVFAGYYLAILCAPICFDDHQLITASLWQKLSRIYTDCHDDAMYDYATRQALDEYKYSYERFNISDKQMQQICYIIGDLYQRVGDLDNARNFFFLAKSNRAGTTALARQSDMRLDEIKELKKADA
ncbi:MAG: DUF2225 domain-containing protein [Oscillospiraceae bacterium]|jgi:uncharacterized protein (DUF2225 family)|nr:DUF2225 domain-containing protein [Oscillospiraceae bacterium]